MGNEIIINLKSETLYPVPFTLYLASFTLKLETFKL